VRERERETERYTKIDLKATDAKKLRSFILSIYRWAKHFNALFKTFYFATSAWLAPFVKEDVQKVHPSFFCLPYL
jgi:hypothetical protein